MNTDKLDYLMDIIELLREDEELDASVHSALLEASNVIYRAAHPEEFE